MSYGAKWVDACIQKVAGQVPILSIFIANTNFGTLYSLEYLDLATGYTLFTFVFLLFFFCDKALHDLAMLIKG